MRVWVCVCVCVYDELVVALCSGAETVFDLHTYIHIYMYIYVCVLSVRHRSKYKKFLHNPNHRRSSQAKRREKERKKNMGGGQGVKERSVRRGTKKKKEKRSFVSTQMLTKNRHQWNAQRWIAKVRDTGWRLPYWLRQWLRFIWSRGFSTRWKSKKCNSNMYREKKKKKKSVGCWKTKQRAALSRLLVSAPHQRTLYCMDTQQQLCAGSIQHHRWHSIFAFWSFDV